LEVLPTLSGVDAVVTSPPYASQRDYGSGFTDWDKTMDSLLTLACATSHCQVLVNLGLIHRNGECVPYWENWRDRMKASGWRFFGWYVWDQGSGMAGDWNGRLGPSHEFVFHFNKVAKRPNKWVKTKGGTHHGNGLRGKDGVASASKTHNGRPTQPFKISDSVIRECRETGRDIGHPARFPVRFSSNLIKSYSSEYDVVLDPFMGSGTTGEACQRLNRRFIGIEKEPKYFDIACKRIQEAMKAEPLWQEACA
jgi:DNA modification methylase